MDRVLSLQAVNDDGVSRLVIGGELPLPVDDRLALLLRSGDDLNHRRVEVGHGDKPGLLSSGQQRGLVHEVLQVRSGEATGAPGQLGQVYILPQRLVAGVDLQNGLPAPDVRVADIDLTVKAAGPQKGRVQNVLTVGSGHDHHALVVAKAVHLHQELIEGLLPFVVATAQARAPLPTHGVNLVD